MSAWIVSKAHIDVLVWALGKRELFPDGMTPDEVGGVLWRENYRSVNYRYGERARVPEYRYAVPPVKWTPDQLTKILGCYDYQSCERNDYGKSKAFGLVKILSESLDREGASRDSEEANTAPWGVCYCGAAHSEWEHIL